MGVACDILIQIPKEKKHITGEPLKGIVKFYLDKDTVYKKISLSLIEKKCTWYDSQHDRPDYTTKRIWAGNHNQYDSYETKPVIKIYLLNKDAILQAGSHKIPFEMIIPENIAPSAKVIDNGTTMAEIRYYLIIKFKKPEIFSSNSLFKTKITIYPRIDSLMTDEPMIVTLNKSLLKLFASKKHEIEVKAELDKGYLTPCSERKISFVVTNNSDVIFTIQTELISKSRTKLGFDDTKYWREVIEMVETPIIPDNSVSNMFNIIPVAEELCTVRNSDVIKREYKLRVTLKLPSPHVDSFVDIPVFVGERVNKGSNEEAGELNEAMEEPPSYWETVLCEEKSKK